MRSSDDTQSHKGSLPGARAPSAEAHLTVLTGDTAGAVHPLGASGALLGRVIDVADGGATALRFPDAFMSRRHAQLEAHGGLWRVRDLGGRNGLFVDGHPLRKNAATELVDGSLLRLSDTLLVFRSGAPPALAIDDPLARPDEPGFPGTSAAAVAVRHSIARLAASRGAVLVLGETGTGKERVVRALAKGAESLVPQNCAELRRELARSELFGHLRGAFSGAVSAKAGLVELADRGVLFLDEVAELALDVQGELLRFLEDGTYRPLGATELRRSSARVVAATNVDLDAAVRAGRFRHDLLMRLRASAAPLHLPPLRERREDILMWAEHLVREAAPGSPRATWQAGAAECLLLCPWPGNLRELRATMRDLAAKGASGAITAEHLPDALRAHRQALRETSVPAADVPMPTPTPAAAAPLDCEAIRAALEAERGSVRAAAAALGVERRQLYRLCERCAIDIDEIRERFSKEK